MLKKLKATKKKFNLLLSVLLILTLSVTASVLPAMAVSGTNSLTLIGGGR